MPWTDSSGPTIGTPEIARVARGEHRVGLSDAGVDPDVGDRPCRACLDDVADEPGRRRRAGAERVDLAQARRRTNDDLVALEHPDRGAVGVEQVDGVSHATVEDVVRVELARQVTPARASRCASCRERRSLS